MLEGAFLRLRVGFAQYGSAQAGSSWTVLGALVVRHGGRRRTRTQTLVLFAVLQLHLTASACPGSQDRSRSPRKADDAKIIDGRRIAAALSASASYR